MRNTDGEEEEREIQKKGEKSRTCAYGEDVFWFLGGPKLRLRRQSTEQI